MTVGDTLATIVLPHTNGLARDEVTMNLAFGWGGGGAPASADRDELAASLTNFINAVPTGAGASIASFINATMSRAAQAAMIKQYDIAGHLDGSPHDSPVHITPFTLFPSNVDQALPNEVAACISFTGALAGVLELGGEEEIPTPRAAQRMGAPPTHLGRAKPKSRRRGRIYVGPLNKGAVGSGAVANNALNDAFLAALLGATHDLTETTTTGNWLWSVWSRRDATLYPVVSSWVDDEADIQRRRGQQHKTKTPVVF